MSHSTTTRRRRSPGRVRTRSSGSPAVRCAAPQGGTQVEVAATTVGRGPSAGAKRGCDTEAAHQVAQLQQLRVVQRREVGRRQHLLAAGEGEDRGSVRRRVARRPGSGDAALARTRERAWAARSARGRPVAGSTGGEDGSPRWSATSTRPRKTWSNTRSNTSMSACRDTQRGPPAPVEVDDGRRPDDRDRGREPPRPLRGDGHPRGVQEPGQRCGEDGEVGRRAVDDPERRRAPVSVAPPVRGRRSPSPIGRRRPSSLTARLRRAKLGTCRAHSSSTPTATCSSPPTCGSATFPPDLRDRAIRLRWNPDTGYDERFVEDRDVRRPGRWPASATPASPSSTSGGGRTTRSSTRPGFDPAERVKVLDAEGIDVAVLYPGLGLALGGIHDPELAVASCRVYNDWIAEFAAPRPEPPRRRRRAAHAGPRRGGRPRSHRIGRARAARRRSPRPNPSAGRAAARSGARPGVASARGDRDCRSRSTPPASPT